ncbi:MAG: hypothetical protein IKQ41_07915 [Clostridia bacterium]|nr:hypothetical protein [Clostridia bacterium]
MPRRKWFADIMGEILKGNQDMANRLAGENPGVERRGIDTIKDFLKKLAGIEGPYIKGIQNVVDMLGNALNRIEREQSFFATSENIILILI